MQRTTLALLLVLFPLILPAHAGEPEKPKSADWSKAETLFAKLRGAENPKSAPEWKEFAANPEAKAVAKTHLNAPAESERGRATALAAMTAFEGDKMADDCAKYALYGKNDRVRQVAREALRTLHVETPDAIVKALHAPEKIGLRALDLIKDRPDEKGLYAIIVAADEEGYGGGGPRSYIFNATQMAYIKDITAVVQVQAVAYDPEIDHIQTGSVLDAKVLKTEVFRRTLYEITGATFDTIGKAREWWHTHKDEIVKRIEEKSGSRNPAP